MVLKKTRVGHPLRNLGKHAYPAKSKSAVKIGKTRVAGVSAAIKSFGKITKTRKQKYG